MSGGWCGSGGGSVRSCRGAGGTWYWWIVDCTSIPDCGWIERGGWIVLDCVHALLKEASLKKGGGCGGLLVAAYVLSRLVLFF